MPRSMPRTPTTTSPLPRPRASPGRRGLSARACPFTPFGCLLARLSRLFAGTPPRAAEPEWEPARDVQHSRLPSASAQRPCTRPRPLEGQPSRRARGPPPTVPQWAPRTPPRAQRGPSVPPPPRSARARRYMHMVKNAIMTTLAEADTSLGSSVNLCEQLWQQIEMEISPSECDIFSYIPDLDCDPLSDGKMCARARRAARGLGSLACARACSPATLDGRAAVRRAGQRAVGCTSTSCDLLLWASAPTRGRWPLACGQLLLRSGWPERSTKRRWSTLGCSTRLASCGAVGRHQSVSL